uniref:Uncharacterized protein n=2 Tax=unclassified Caudoviricetes TaxID=2788787 RepID=A0A8S5NNR3_9CAUD|nr:MAG TPA: hypothetical protein [Myoviridae sp. ctSGm32]DAD99000.1 MAG TPA: hypothetical protein [Myoviridae sp. ctjs85]
MYQCYVFHVFHTHFLQFDKLSDVLLVSMFAYFEKHILLDLYQKHNYLLLFLNMDSNYSFFACRFSVL